VLFALNNGMQAQIGNAIRNKASQAIGKIGKKAEKGAEEKIDSVAAQKVEQEAERRTEEAGKNRERRSFNIGGLFGGKVTLKYENEYSFHNYLFMQAEMFTDKGPVKMDYYMYFNTDERSGCVETKILADDGSVAMKTSIISDDKNKCLLMLSDMGSMRMGYISEVPVEQPEQQINEVEDARVKITKTGNTRVIAGYRCDEYLYREEGEKVYGKVWITTDLKLNTDRRSLNTSNLPKYYSKLPQDGTVLAMETYDENNQLTMRSETKEIKKNINFTISTSGYSLRQINYNQMQEQSKQK